MERRTITLKDGRTLTEIKQGRAIITMLLDKDGGVSGIHSTLEGTLRGGLDEDEIVKLL